MSFQDLIGTLDNIVLSTFSEKQVTVYPIGGLPVISINTVVKNPAMEEDYTPGSQQGTAMLLLFVRASDNLGIERGAKATYGGVDYDIVQVDADREGGLTLRMRRRS